MRKAPLFKLAFAAVLLTLSAFGLLNFVAEPAHALNCPATKVRLGQVCVFAGVVEVGPNTCACSYACPDGSTLFGPFGNC